MNILFSQFLVGVVFLTIVYLHIVKKNFDAAIAYGIQSLAIAIILFSSFFETRSVTMLIIIFITVIVKAILAPIFFIKLIQKHHLTFSVGTYLNVPSTLIAIVILAAVAHSQKLAPLTGIIFNNQVLLTLALSSMLLSLFLIVNRKGALSQIIGVLSLENSIVMFAVFAGLEQSATLQLGIIFDIFVWLLIATTFVSMIYKHFGSLDITSMRNLKD